MSSYSGDMFSRLTPSAAVLLVSLASVQAQAVDAADAALTVNVNYAKFQGGQNSTLGYVILFETTSVLLC